MAGDSVEAISRLANSVERACVGMGVLSAHDRWLDANERLCEILGYSREELLALSRTDTTHPEDQSGEARELERVRKGEVGATQLEERLRLRDGESLWVSVTAARVRSEGPHGAELVLIVQDLTARRESQRGLSVQHLVSQIIAESKAPPETLQAVLAGWVGKALRWSYETYWELDRGAGYSVPSTVDEAASSFTAFDRKTKGLVLGRGEGFPGRVLEMESTPLGNDMAAPPVYPRSGGGQC